MLNGWSEVLLGDAVEDITVGWVGPMPEYRKDGVAFLRSLNVKALSISTDDLRYISREFHQRILKSALKPGDVVIVRTGEPGTAAVIPEWLTEANCADLVIVRPGSGFNSHYLAYLLTAIGRDQIDAHIVGAVQQHFNVGSAKLLRVPRPPRAKQDAIANVLRVLDERIDLNREMNRSLEATIAAIFRSWFVEFDPVTKKAAGGAPPNMSDEIAALFPSDFKDGVPARWDQVFLSAVATISKGQTNPKDKPSELFEHYSIPAYDNNKVPVRQCGNSIQSNKFRVPSNSILVSKLNPEILRVWWPTEEVGHNSVCSTEFIVLQPKPSVPLSFLYCLLTERNFREELCGSVTGTSNSHQRIKPDDLMRIYILRPSRLS